MHKTRPCDVQPPPINQHIREAKRQMAYDLSPRLADSCSRLRTGQKNHTVDIGKTGQFVQTDEKVVESKKLEQIQSYD